jgi:predicted ArsR family transcriptional regulator
MPGRVASFWPSPGTHSNGALAPTMNGIPADRKEPGLPPGSLDALAALGEPTRRALYGFVVAQDRPVSRDEAAAATGTKRATATFHLERLVDDGLLEARFARLSGRTGPGAGRTAKLYARAARQFAVSLPPRRYEIAGEVLASALELLQCQAAPAGEAVAEAASQAGRQLAAGGTDLAELLGRSGYEPRQGPGGCIHLARSTNWSPATPAWSAR